MILWKFQYISQKSSLYKLLKEATTIIAEQYQRLRIRDNYLDANFQSRIKGKPTSTIENHWPSFSLDLSDWNLGRVEEELSWCPLRQSCLYRNLSWSLPTWLLFRCWISAVLWTRWGAGLFLRKTEECFRKWNYTKSFERTTLDTHAQL